MRTVLTEAYRRHLMRVLALIVVTVIAADAEPASAESSTHKYIADALKAMGGEARFQGISDVTYSAVGTRQMVEQSERPSGPYFIDHFSVREVRDLNHHRARIEESHEAYAADDWWLQQSKPHTSVTVINDDVAATLANGKYTFAGSSSVQQNQEQFAFAPERVLLTAQAATDLRSDADLSLHGMPSRAGVYVERRAVHFIYQRSEQYAVGGTMDATVSIPDIFERLG